MVAKFLTLILGSLALVGCTASNAHRQSPATSTGIDRAIDQTARLHRNFGDVDSVTATVDAVRTYGNLVRIGSQSIRLPTRPLGEIAMFNYRFPPTCGGHQFRLYESDNARILELVHVEQGGYTHTIRDYLVGPSPFVAPGLWTAYDHTAASLSTMTSDIADSTDSRYGNVYSRGLVTGLPAEAQSKLGNAYQAALTDARHCSTTEAVAGIPAD